MRAKRLNSNPIITAEADSIVGDNVNGPSIIRVPDWIENPLGRYYLYFAHHSGVGIRMAYADRIDGPWTIHQDHVLKLESTRLKDHIASPDAHVNQGEKEIILYFHGRIEANNPTQKTAIAASKDGIHFEQTAAPPLGAPYWRVFQFENRFYALEKPGRLLRARNWDGPFESGPELLPENTRHSAVLRVDQTLYLFFSRIGDKPERILWSKMELIGDWNEWKANPPLTLLQPKEDYEGGHLPLHKSESGASEAPERALRDPAIFQQADKTYLAYSISGESGLALAELDFRSRLTDGLRRILPRVQNTTLSGVDRLRQLPPIRKCNQVWRSRDFLIQKHLRGVRISNPPTFIVGCGHSGTSILLAVMSAHSRIGAIPGETGVGRLDNSEAFQEQIDAFDRMTIAQGKYRWAEKTPNHILHLDNIFEKLPEAKVIIVIRDGLDVAASIKKRSGSAIEGAHRWVHDNNCGKRYWGHENVLKVHYESLITDFTPTISRILEFMGEDYEEGMKNFHTTPKKWYADRLADPGKASGTRHNQHRNWQINQPIFDGRGKWKTLSEEELTEVETIEAPLLEELGYAREPH